MDVEPGCWDTAVELRGYCNDDVFGLVLVGSLRNICCTPRQRQIHSIRQWTLLYSGVTYLTVGYNVCFANSVLKKVIDSIQQVN